MKIDNHEMSKTFEFHDLGIIDGGIENDLTYIMRVVSSQGSSWLIMQVAIKWYLENEKQNFSQAMRQVM